MSHFSCLHYTVFAYLLLYKITFTHSQFNNLISLSSGFQVHVKFMQNSSTCWWCDARSTWRKPTGRMHQVITHRRCSEEVSTPENYARAAMTHIIIIAVAGAHRRVLSHEAPPTTDGMRASGKTRRDRDKRLLW